ncbi:MAG TPA: hypothetical protein DEO70_05610 [Bacteroidales bacterium]|nr:MAG: hypothetical protein A2X11_16920 [Bacteroidetes bacterium GWE2_42_24]OFY25169.1 MAG: hypothetical protein A2X09_05085 [Bacteroidetes bacterium GWF2_43_11]HBZ66296.1 hypothetical protein [Bacteroidales bacterium]
MKYLASLFIGLMAITSLSAQTRNNVTQATYSIALLKYAGGGDWYANPTSLPNLIKFCNETLNTGINTTPATVEPGDPGIGAYPFVHLTGHGNVVFNDAEATNLRNYLIGGGFLHIDDNYGLDQYISPQMKKVFPELEFIPLPPTHQLFSQPFRFPKGLPKIHEHDNKPPQAFALIYNGRIVCLYTYETDLGDGWEDPEVHHDTKEKHLDALRMGANIVQFVFNGETTEQIMTEKL